LRFSMARAGRPRGGGRVVDSFAGVELSPGLEQSLKPAEFRRFLQLGALTAGNRWLDKWLPMRWNTQYAVNVLGAAPGRDGVPFFHYGRMIQHAASSRARVAARGRSVELQIKIPAMGLNFHAGQRKAFTRLPLPERLDIDQWFAQTIEAAMIAAATGKGSLLGRGGKGPRMQRIRLTTTDATALRGMRQNVRASTLARRSALRERSGQAFAGIRRNRDLARAAKRNADALRAPR
jgi:hypothetical protein